MRRLLLPVSVFLALLVAHAPLLNLPYYWDEAGYFVAAALDFFRHGWLIPQTTLANGHPPLLSAWLALVWTATGAHPWATRVAMLVWATALVCGVYHLARRHMSGRQAAVPAFLIAIAPLCFAQSTMAQLDLPVAALVVWALVFPRHRWQRAALLSAACLTKETAVIVPVTLLVVEFSPWLLLPIATLAGWFVFYHHITGYWFGNPQYFAYNVGQAAFSLPRIGMSLLRRIWQLAGYNGTWLLTALALWAAFRHRDRTHNHALLPRGATPSRGDSRAGPRANQICAIIAVYLVFHAVVGGAVLARYLLPALALFFILATRAILTLPRAGLWIALVAAFLVVNWFWNPPYPFPYEDNLAYVQFVHLHQAAARSLEASPPNGAVWTAWPATDELSKPDLGYVTTPIPIHPLEDFSPQSLAAIAQPVPELYIYSREYQPRRDVLAWLPFWRRWGDRYFHHSAPAPSEAWLARLGLTAHWEKRDRGQWALLASH
ncbi:MAG TPA: glycosyltransferase family 39 protein [Terriglobales bacterium]|nr:glycosyltransferase family 39 protein [Terriglobales bacterium]